MIYLVTKNQRIIANDIIQLAKSVKTDANKVSSKHLPVQRQQ